MLLIVGGAGYIGSHFNQLASSKGHKTVVLDNLSTGHREFCRWGAFVQGDLASPEQLRQVFKDYSIDCVLHFAAHAYVGESVTAPEKYYANNVTGTLNLLSAMKAAGVNKIVFSSTCATFGNVTTPINVTGRHFLYHYQC